ncbi:MAG: recombination regulator RecX [Candidatus Andersenbacteria bacterium]|nr:recombination regulator RecX [Candidatus Andersenbacteria bacterium]
MSKSPKEHAIDILARRDHSIHEMRMKLKRKIFDPEAIEDTIVWLQEKRLLNDADFAQKKAESIMRTKMAGPMYIKNKLREAGVAGEIIDDVVQNIADAEEWGIRAQKAIEQWKRAHVKHAEDKTRQMRFLVSRGFDRIDL